MKSDIVITESFMHQPGYDMFSGMLLHLLKTFFPVDLTGYSFPGFQCLLCRMIDDAFLLMYIQHTYIIQHSGVCILTAAFREEGGAI